MGGSTSGPGEPSGRPDGPSASAAEPSGGRIGLLGGTFDPPHVGHLIVAQDIYERLMLDLLLIVPAGSPPHREALLDAETRFALTAEAFADDPRFELSRVELEREGPSYTVDTLRWIHDTRAPDELFCVIGQDQLEAIESWHRYEEIFSLCRLAVMARAGEPPAPPVAGLRIEPVEVTRVDVSGTRVRARLREGRSIRYLVPERIRERVETAWRDRGGSHG